MLPFEMQVVLCVSGTCGDWLRRYWAGVWLRQCLLAMWQGCKVAEEELQGAVEQCRIDIAMDNALHARLSEVWIEALWVM